MESRYREADAQRCLDAYAPRWGEDLALRVYTSRLLGQEPALVLHGGGNTSVKSRVTELFGDATEVLYVKPGEHKNFCIIDAAMNDLPRPAMYQAFHAIVPVAAAPTPGAVEMTYDVVGPVCESGDWIGRDRTLAVVAGDQLAVMSAGAYCMSMASNYNTRGRAAEVLVDGARVHLIRERETAADQMRAERLVP